MSKVKKAWFCQECGYESTKWLGRCSSCGAWNSMIEEVLAKEPERPHQAGAFTGQKSQPIPLPEVTFSQEARISLNNEEVDRLLGGGLVEGSLVLLGGEPGIGKSTLSLQIPLHCPHLKTLYVSGEESARQIKLRANRLTSSEHAANHCYILCETLLENILQHAQELNPAIIVIDSIQTMYSQHLDSSPGSVSQIRECAARLLQYAKERNTPVILIGHITKEGSIAGPKVLEHIVDVVLQFEGDSKNSYRILRGIKNRFGSVAELAIFEMLQNGLRQVNNPSEILIPMHAESLSGIAVAAMVDGTRPFLIETQALVSTAAYGTPQRSATGFDARRLNMLLAVLEKRAGFKLSVKDVFLNMAGGLKVNDPAVDLAVTAAILSSNFDLPLAPRSCFAAEVGLSGEIRPVAHIDRRIAEAQKLGFEAIYISKFSGKTDASLSKKIKVIPLADMGGLCKAISGRA
ncbi:MAG: DNA repair protein RadA [Bacteroidales bacterium]|nr:DNA repair protein RadA [Bacteroidales bacterium]MCL2739091.1 DNA repair protein RadA [Bacteroidales bacterium]